MSPEAVGLATLPPITEYIRNQTGANLLHIAAAFDSFSRCTAKERAFEYLDAQDAQGRTPLHVAVEQGKPSSVNALLALHPTLDLLDQAGNSVLHYAAASSNGSRVATPILTELLATCSRELSEHAYRQLVNCLNGAGQTALALACASGQAECAKELLRLGANLHGAALGVTQEYLNRHSSCQLFSTSSPEVGALPTSSAKLTPAQLLGSFDLNLLKDGGTPLHWSVSAAGTRAEVLARWLELGVDVNALNWAQKSALHVAVGRADLAATLLLLSSGADVNSRDGTGHAPLHLAVKLATPTSGSLTVHQCSQVVAIVQAILVFGGEVNALTMGEQPEGSFSARHLVSKGGRSMLRDQLLYVLHSVDARRCSISTGSGGSRLTCAEGCSSEGFDFNGMPFDLPANVSLRSSPLYDTLLIGEVVEAAVKEALESSKKNSKTSQILKSKKKEKKKKLRLLSLDGGGIRGLIMIQLMDWLERTSGRRIVDTFDWISGTSTGGILALMLGSGFSGKFIN